jgi:hypothetical protein
MKGMEAKQVMNGSQGELWIDSDYMSQVTEFKATVTIEKSEINMVKKLSKQYKVTGYTCKGSLKMNHVSSYMIKKMNDNMKAGKQTVCTIISKLDDPDAIGSERIVIKDAVFDELILADWSAKKMGEESYNFTFSDWDILDTADEN